ncbi:hypothetical protein D3C77_557770 [compost metagenome]
MGCLELRVIAQLRKRQMGQVALASRPIGELARVLLGVLNQILDRRNGVLLGPFGVDVQNERRVQYQGNGSEILGLVLGVLVDQGVDRDAAAVGGQQRVAIRRRTGHLGRPDRSIGAALVLHDDGLLERLGQRIREQASHRVRDRTGRERHDDLDGFSGPCLVLRERGR